MFDGYMHWNVLSGITLPCAPVSTLTRSVAGVSGLPFSVILRVAYTSSLSTALMLTVLKASGLKLSLSWSNLASWLMEWTPPRWRSSRLGLRLDLARDLGRPEECRLPPAPDVQPVACRHIRCQWFSLPHALHLLPSAGHGSVGAWWRPHFAQVGTFYRRPLDSCVLRDRLTWLLLLASPENCCILASVASCVLATSIAALSVSVSSRHSFSCTFPCRTPTTNCSINLSSVSVASRNLHFRACVLQRVMNSSTVSELNCLNFCRWKTLSL